MPANFVHLKIHTEYSIVDGVVRLADLVAACKENNMPAVAMTDRVNLFGLVKFYKKAIASGIKPIMGCDFLLKEAGSIFLITALCKNQMGYKNCRELISKA
ncbi:MAG TPA: PHP domain-containing protein, partial [Coxiellaceae bacterium]|nr:PHP domain-containing protein [Coxiellaceae bacterium]